MIAAARAPAVKAELEGLTGSPSVGQSAGSGISSGLFGKAPTHRNKSALMAAFGGEDEEEDRPRALKKLNYSAEELAAAQASMLDSCFAFDTFLLAHCQVQIENIGLEAQAGGIFRTAHF